MSVPLWPHESRHNFYDVPKSGDFMVDKTVLVLPGKRLSVYRPFKRTLQVFASMGLTALTALVIVVTNGMLTTKSDTTKGFDQWLSFVQRPDIMATAALTAIVTVFFVYWQRGTERK